MKEYRCRHCDKNDATLVQIIDSDQIFMHNEVYQNEEFYDSANNLIYMSNNNSTIYILPNKGLLPCDKAMVEKHLFYKKQGINIGKDKVVEYYLECNSIECAGNKTYPKVRYIRYDHNNNIIMDVDDIKCKACRRINVVLIQERVRGDNFILSSEYKIEYSKAMDSIYVDYKNRDNNSILNHHLLCLNKDCLNIDKNIKSKVIYK